MDTNLIIDNINNAIVEGQEKSLATQILDLQEEYNAIELELKQKRKDLQEYMESNDINKVETKTAIFTVYEKKNIKVDKEKAKAFLDSIGTYEEFSKLDETKVKKIYPTAEFVKESEPTKILKITEVK